MRAKAIDRYGVLVADVLGSTARSDVHFLLHKKLLELTRTHRAKGLIRLPYAVTAGDEFQTLTLALEEIPALILDLRRTLRPLALRIGIGIGAVADRVRPPVNRLGGPAFQFARRALESTQGDAARKFRALTAFRSGDALFDTAANLIYGLHDTLLQNISDKQWETINVFLAKRRVDLTARALRLNISTASRNLRRGYFWQLQETVTAMRALLAARFPRLHVHVQKPRIARTHAIAR